MSGFVVDDTPISGKQELIDWIARGIKDPADARTGSEHEKLPFHISDNSPVSYLGPNGIQALLLQIKQETGWKPLLEGDDIIGVLAPDGGSITLEPGGQVELSGAPHQNMHAVEEEFQAHMSLVKSVGKKLDIGFLGSGTSPKWPLSETPRMPKGRYTSMHNYLSTRGVHSLDMMYRSCTIQTNVDFFSEEDMVQKLRLALAIQPIVAVLWASSPFLDGKRTGLVTSRYEFWKQMDNDRCGNIPFAFDDNMGFERYVDYALDIPILFIKRGETYYPAAQITFRDFLNGKTIDIPNPEPTMADWGNHLSCIFPDVRLKTYIEMRGADMGGAPWVSALSAFWVGLLYDEQSLGEAIDYVKHWPHETRESLYRHAARHGLTYDRHGVKLVDVADRLVKIATSGLKRRSQLNAKEQDETIFLDVVYDALQRRETQSDQLIALFEGAWKQDVTPIFRHAAL